MTNFLTLIESEVLDELIEDHFAIQQLQNPICSYVLNQIDWKQVEIDKKNFLSKYVNVDVNLNQSIVEALEERGYE